MPGLIALMIKVGIELAVLFGFTANTVLVNGNFLVDFRYVMVRTRSANWAFSNPSQMD